MVLDLAGVRYPIPYLKIFSVRGSIGTLVAGSNWVQNCTVGGYLHDVVQTLSGVGSDNPCLDKLDRINFQIGCQLRTYSRADPP